jgi:alpha-tubulin suppressor-like RCC1 family protein
MRRLHLFLLNTTILCSSIVAYSQSNDLHWETFGAGGPRFFAIKSDGTLWASGTNFLGEGSSENRMIPVQIGSDSNWLSVLSGGAHTVALKKDSTLWTWGMNNSGQLGDGTTEIRSFPVQIGSDKWSKIAPGSFFTMGINKDGTLWGWGANGNGELGDGTTIQRTTPVQIGTDNNWEKLSLGESNSLALKKDGTLWGWGANFDGQLGDGTTIQRTTPVQIGTDNSWVKIHSGTSFSLALKNNGTLWSWGSNFYGELGNNTTIISQTVPVQIGTGNQWQNIGGGAAHGLAVRNDGTVWAWGRNEFGQLGDGTTIKRTEPIQVNTISLPVTLSSSVYLDYSAILSSDGRIFCFTGNDYGQFGNNIGHYGDNYAGIPFTTYTCDNSFCLNYNLANSTVSYSIPAGGEGNRVDFQDGCRLASSITPWGANPLIGEVKDSVWLEDAPPTTSSGQPYVQRHYGITPIINAANATAILTLYYSQEDFTAYNSMPNHGLDLPHDALDEANNKANLRVVKRSGTSNNGTGLYDTYTGDAMVIVPQTVVWNSKMNAWAVTFEVAGFSGFFVTSSTVAVVLPVKLIDFTARLKMGDVVLIWNIESEVEFSTYEVERSTDGRSFNRVQIVNATGLTTSNHYSYTDKIIGSKSNPVMYYRLKLINKDGSFTYSKIVLVNINSYLEEVVLYPNPVNESATLTIKAMRNENLHYQIVDVNGKVFMQKIIAVMNGVSNYLVNTKMLTPGNYTLQLKGNYIHKEIKFIKQ